MNKNEFELKKLAIKAGIFSTVMNFLHHVATLLAGVAAVYFIMTGLSDMVKSNPDSLRALAVVIEKLKVNVIISYFLTAGAAIGFAYERHGKKRAIRKLDEMRTALESGDPYKPSSNLDENGHTPKVRKPR